jgi:P4 family phage/plasmid primase-like protien
MPEKKNPMPLNGKTPKVQHTGVDAQTVLDRALKSKESNTIQLLLDGDNAGLSYYSDGDLVLCKQLVFFFGTGSDADCYNIVDYIIQNSKRMRPKWDTVHRPADGATYGQMTIETAISGTTDRYTAHAKDDLDLWDFDDAEIHIEKQRGRDLSSSQKLELTGDILRHHDFDPLQRDIIVDLLKKVTGFTKGAMADVQKNNEGSKPEIDSRTHAELSADFVKNSLPNDPAKRAACESHIWIYNDDDGIFDATPPAQLAIIIGDTYEGQYSKKGGDYKSISAMIHDRVLDENFFSEAPRGLPGSTSFYAVDRDNGVQRFDYTPKLRQRFKLPCDPDPNTKMSMFSKFLSDSFPDDINQEILVQEIFGILLTGMAPWLQIAFLFYGFGHNGKSVFLEIIQGLVSQELRCCIKPEMFVNEYYRAGLAGKMLNIVGDIGQEQYLTADFKDIVSCDVQVTARLPYRDPFSFIPQCGHLFAGNCFPQTRDHSFGMYRRWAIVHFKHTVPFNDRIPGLAKLILKDEAPAILSWALTGAKRVVDQGFQLTPTEAGEALKQKWKNLGDSLEAFLNDDEAAIIDPGSTVERTKAYRDYRDYCSRSGVKPLPKIEFYDRMDQRFRPFKKPFEPRSYAGLSTLSEVL